MKSYLTGRTQSVWCNGSIHARSALVLHKVLGPLLFILYVADIRSIAKAFGLSLHTYADDGQIYSSLPAVRYRRATQYVLSELHIHDHWMDEGDSPCLEFRQDRIPMNQQIQHSGSGKKEAVDTRPIQHMGYATIVPSASLHLLGVLLDDTLLFDAQTNNVIRCCHYQVRRVRRVQNYLSLSAAMQLVWV